MPDLGKNNRIQQLEEARGLATEGCYVDALAFIEKILVKNSSDLEALRLKGNVLELKALDENEYSSKKLASSSDYLLARQCYEVILRTDARNTIALIDFGDHYKNLNAYDKALTYYLQAAESLDQGESRLSREEEVRDLLDRSIELSKQKRVATRAAQLQAACQTMLARAAGPR